MDNQTVPPNNSSDEARWCDIDPDIIERKIDPMWEMAESFMDSRPSPETMQGRITI